MKRNECLLDIIIVNYKSTDYLSKSLQSIYNDVKDFPVNIFIQDNASDDGVEKINDTFPEVQITLNQKNIGFARAINSTIQNSNAPYVMLVNPDTIIQKGFFKTVLQYMEENPTIGIVGPKILNQDGSSVQGSARAFPNLLTGFFGRTSFLSKWFPNNSITRNNILTKKINGTQPVEVDWISGACMVIRRSTLDDVGLMDERFYMYWEDVDWCRRMWIKGWKIVYYPKISMIHFVGGSSRKRPIKSIYEFHKSCYRYFIKYPVWPLKILRPVVFFGLSFRFVFATILHYLSSPSKKIPGKRKKILFLITEDWYFWTHRLPIAREAKAAGYEVLIATRVHAHRKRIEQEGFKLIPINLKRKSKSLTKEVYDFLEIVRIYRKEKPDIVHHVAIKPVLYGSCAARIASVPGVVNALAGLGSVFVSKKRHTKVIRTLVLFAFRTVFSINNSICILQNPEDLNFLLKYGVIKRKQAVLIRGAGVNLTEFSYTPEPTGSTTIVCASRMIWDKGIGEFVKVAEKIHQEYKDCRFFLIGVPDPENPTSIPEQTLRNWHASGVIEWFGFQANMPKILQEANIIVLPSVYGEGVPKILIEAASCGRPVVTTDIPGCREIIRNNENGLLVPSNDLPKLVNAIKQLIEHQEIREEMGKNGRKIVENEFSEERVVAKTMKIYDRVLSNAVQCFN